MPKAHNILCFFHKYQHKHNMHILYMGSQIFLTVRAYCMLRSLMRLSLSTRQQHCPVEKETEETEQQQTVQ